MTDTHHHNQKRWFDGSPERGYMGHAPAWFRRWLVRRDKRRATAAIRRGLELAPQKKTADWNWW